MTKDLETTEGPAKQPVTESGRFDQISIAPHWLTVLLITVQFTSAVSKHTEPYAELISRPGINRPSPHLAYVRGGFALKER
jgi:hypothetical protein